MIFRPFIQMSSDLDHGESARKRWCYALNRISINSCVESPKILRDCIGNRAFKEMTK